jgi:hypothetical protein
MSDPQPVDDPFEKLAAEARDQLKRDGLTDFNAGLRAQLEQEPDPEPEAETAEPETPDGEDGEPEPAEDEPTSPQPEPAPAAETFTIDGIPWTRDQMEAAARFAAAARQAASDPLRAQHLADVLEGRWQPEQAAQTPPPDVDLEDPAIAYLASRLDQISQQVASYTTAQQQVYDDMAARRQAEANSVYTRARASFQSEHALSDDEMARVDAKAAELNVLPGLMRNADLLTATTQAFTLGLRSDETLYQRDLQRAAAAERDLRTRKAKANSVSAGSGAAPREPSKPQDPFAAMVEAVKADMFPPA